MIRFLPLFTCCLLSCNATTSPPMEPTLEVTISDAMYRAVTCRLKDDQLVWCQHGMPKDLIVRAEKTSTVPYVIAQAKMVAASVYLEKYTSQGPDIPVQEISFFHVEHSRKGVMDKRLTLPDTCTFWLQKADGYYIITNIVRE